MGQKTMIPGARMWLYVSDLTNRAMTVHIGNEKPNISPYTPEISGTWHEIEFVPPGKNEKIPDSE